MYICLYLLFATTFYIIQSHYILALPLPTAQLSPSTQNSTLKGGQKKTFESGEGNESEKNLRQQYTNRNIIYSYNNRDPDTRNHEELGCPLGGYSTFTKLEKIEFQHQVMLETNLYRKECISTKKNNFTCISYKGQNIDIVYGIAGELLIYICGIGAYDVLIRKYKYEYMYR